MLLLLLATVPAWACGDVRSRAQALGDADLAGWRILVADARADTACDEALRTFLATRLSALLIAHAAVLADQSAPVTEQRRVLEEALSHRRNWLALAQLGRLALDRRDWATASRLLEEALVSIDDPVETPQAPPLASIARVVQLAQEARLLAHDYVPSPVTRSGAPGGLAAPSVRGFALVSVPVPVQFQFDSTDFTTKGWEAAQALMASLMAEGSPAITLVGHTDPVGPDDYNRTLSLDRAQALADHLIRGGYPGRIAVDGRGESQPLVVSDPDAYTREELHQLFRRVELVR